MTEPSAPPATAPLEYESPRPAPTLAVPTVVRPGRGLKRFRTRWLALAGGTLIALYLCWRIIEPFTDVLLWAGVLVIVFFPVHVRLVRWIGKPAWAAAVSCLLVVVVIVAPLVGLTFAVVNEATDTAAYLQQNADRLFHPDTEAYRFLNRFVDLKRVVSWEYIVTKLKAGSGVVASQTFIIATGGVVAALKFLFIIITMYYLFRDGEQIRETLLNSLPLDRAHGEQIFSRTQEVIGASVYGVLVIATLQAILGGLGFMVAGLPSPLLWTVVLFFLSMIPAAGSFAVWVPACLYLVVVGRWGWGIALAVWCVLAVSVLDNVLRPRLVGKRTRMHELLVLFSVIGGLQVFGALGLVIGPVVVAITLALLEVYRQADQPTTLAVPVVAALPVAAAAPQTPVEVAAPAPANDTPLGGKRKRRRRGR